MQSEGFDGIADASKPNAGRMYDFFLGGNHNFEVDREAAQEVINIAPHLPEFLRTVRWFLGEAVRRLSSQGYDKFIDFASGLPTSDHIHNITPEGAKVVYSDIDPVTVAYAQEIIGNDPNVEYVHCDASRPEELLHSDVVNSMFGDERKVAIGFNGIVWFMPNEDVERSLQVLYDWAGEGSRLFVCHGDVNMDEPETWEESFHRLVDFYGNVGSPFYFRKKEILWEMAKPWEVDEPGFMPLEDWLDMPRNVEEKVREIWGTGNLYGGILKK